MAVVPIEIDGTDVRVWLEAYNPRDAWTVAVSQFVVARAAESMKGVTRADVIAWLRKERPEWSEICDAIERGEPIPRDVRIGEFPVSPGDAQFEAPIAAYLAAKSRSGKRG
jgi:hypothetical protein